MFLMFDQFYVNYLVGVFHYKVFSFFQFHAGVNDAAEDAPGVVHVQIDLTRKLDRLKLLGAQNNVLGRILVVNS